MRFQLIDEAKKEFPVQRLCKVLDVSPSGYFADRLDPVGIAVLVDERLYRLNGRSSSA